MCGRGSWPVGMASKFCAQTMSLGNRVMRYAGAFLTARGRTRCARPPWSRAAGLRAPGARRRAWRWTRAPCAGRRRRSPPGCRARRYSRTSVYSGVPWSGWARRTPPRRASAAPRTSGALPGSGFSASRQQHAPDLDRGCRGSAAAACVDHARARRPRPGRVFLGDHAAVELQHHLARHHVGVGAAFDAADVQVRVGDARHLRRDLPVAACSARTAR